MKLGNNIDFCAQIKVVDAEGNNVSFRKLLLNRCQKEFEKEKQDEQALLEKNNQLEGLSVRTNSKFDNFKNPWSWFAKT